MHSYQQYNRDEADIERGRYCEQFHCTVLLVGVMVFSLPSRSRRRSSNCSRKPTANQLDCDHGNVTGTSWCRQKILGNVVYNRR